MLLSRGGGEGSWMWSHNGEGGVEGVSNLFPIAFLNRSADTKRGLRIKVLAGVCGTAQTQHRQTSPIGY